MIVELPLRLQVSKRGKNKFFYLNLNNYRNAHFHKLNKAKIMFKEIAIQKLKHIQKFKKVRLTYILYPQTKAKRDVANVCSIVDKFFSDALVEAGKLEDDNYRFVPIVSFHYGRVCKNNPRVDVHIEEYDETFNHKPTIKEQDHMRITLTSNEIKTAILSQFSWLPETLLENAQIDLVSDDGTGEMGAVITSGSNEVSVPVTASTKGKPTTASKPASETVQKAKTATPAQKPKSILNISSGSDEREEPDVETPSTETTASNKPNPFANADGSPVETDSVEEEDEAPQVTEDENPPAKKSVFTFSKR